MNLTRGDRAYGGQHPIKILSNIPTRESKRADACVEAVRACIARDYPLCAIEALVRIVEKHGLDCFPEALLIDGRLDDLSVSGARAGLESALIGESADSRDPHPLFSRTFYMWGNSDVAESEVSAWLHYQRFGIREGRSPHPLLDVDYMAMLAPDVQRSEIIDRYLRTPDLWTIDTSPYVDCQKYILHGGWSGTSSPIGEIVCSGAFDPWVHSRLIAIDAALGDTTHDALGPVVFLLKSNHPRSMFSRMTLWRSPEQSSGPPSSGGLFTVVPGFFVGSEGIERWSDSRLAMSPDVSLVRFSDGLVGIEIGDLVTVDELRFVCGTLARDHLAEIVDCGQGTLAVAPSSSTQESALRYLVEESGARGVTVLPWGNQVRVAAGSIRQVDGSAEGLPQWDWPDVDPRDVVFIDQGPLGDICAADARVGDWLKRGASLFLIDKSAVERWVSAFVNRPYVVATPATEEFVGSIVAPARAAVLGAIQ